MARRHYGCENKAMAFAAGRGLRRRAPWAASRPPVARTTSMGINEDRALGGLYHLGRDATQPHALHGPEASVSNGHEGTPPLSFVGGL
jgi:hypothetical protein